MNAREATKSFSGGSGGEPFSKGSPRAGFGAAAPFAAKPQLFKALNKPTSPKSQTTLPQNRRIKNKADSKSTNHKICTM